MRAVLMSAAIATVSSICSPAVADIDGDIRLNIGLFDEGKIVPFYTGFASVPLHPGGVLGTELYYRRGEHHRLFQTLNLGYYYHRLFEHGLFVDTEIGYQYVNTYGFFVETLFGVGYLHTFIDGVTYGFDESAGQFEEISDNGRPHAMAPIVTLGAGIDLAEVGYLPAAFTIRYQCFLEMPHSSDSFLMSHSVLYLSALFWIRRGSE